MVDFSGAGAGECWVWGLSYTGNVLAQMGDNAATTTLTDGCYELSSNFVVVFRDSIEGGTVASEEGADTLYVCYTGGTPLVYAFDSTGTVGSNFNYVVTDPNGTILGLPPADMVDFGPAGPGECWVWGLSYNGTLTAQTGDDATSIALSDECFELSSNFIVVIRDSSGAACATDVDPLLDIPDLKVFPVPASNQVSIEFSAPGINQLEGSLEIQSTLGQILNRRPVSAAAGSQISETFDLSSYPPGIYLMHIRTDTGLITRKFIKN